MSLHKSVLTSIAAAVVTTAFWSAPANACSWPPDLFGEAIRGSDKIEGSFRVTSIDERTIAGTDNSEQPWSRVFHGVVIDRQGRRTTEVEFEISSIDAIRTCTPFTLPEADVSGTFYLEQLESDRYQLVHWKADT